jgi:hypothetical protein
VTATIPTLDDQPDRELWRAIIARFPAVKAESQPLAFQGDPPPPMSPALTTALIATLCGPSWRRALLYALGDEIAQAVREQVQIELLHLREQEAT